MMNEYIIKLTHNEAMQLSSVFRDAERNDEDLLKIRNVKIRLVFERSYRKNHKLWLKITHQIENQLR